MSLADEYLYLSYHARLNVAVGQGLPAKDKSFNATMSTDYDESLSADEAGISNTIIPQYIGRVILNLYNNTFYAVAEKKQQLVEKYEPTLSVITKMADNKVELIVADNGNGIPQKILDKIFQPFFTTKPTGQVTALGLSLSYDIVKAHGGVPIAIGMKVETKEGEGSEFIMQLSMP